MTVKKRKKIHKKQKITVILKSNTISLEKIVKNHTFSELNNVNKKLTIY